MAAEAMAAKYFNCEAGRLVFEQIKAGDETSDWLIFAFNGTKGELADMDAGFGLFYESDGVFLEIFPERGIGEPLNRVALSNHLSRKNISHYDESAVQLLVVNRSGRAKIAPAQQEYFFGEDISIEILQHDMEARIILLAPEPGGAPIEFETAKQKLLQAGIINGLDEQALRDVLNEKNYGNSVTVATATQPVDGENGKIIFHFQTDPITARPKEIEGGRVDYKTLDLYVPVSEGQVLVTRTPATEGTPGMSVKGKPIKQRPGKEVVFPKGKNVQINAEKTEMRANAAGMVEYVHGSVNVSNIYKIDGNVDLSVGNIDFDGSVHIGGNIQSGHIVRATGGVIVGGVVEASEIIAGGNVEIKRGMQGMDKGRIEAGGSISILYIERGKVVAGGSITVDASIHSVLEAGESLYARGKRGSIIGGRAFAAKEIVAVSVGSVSNTQTDVEAGFMPQKRARMEFLEKETERLAGEMTKLDQLDAYLDKARAKLDAATFDKLYRSGIENRRIYTEQIKEFSEEIAVLKEELERAIDGKIHVLDTVYAGARVTIASDVYKVNDDMQYATFKFKDGQVVWVPCEKSKSG